MKKIIFLTIVMILFLVPTNVEARTLHDIKTELAEMEEKLKEAQNNEKMTQEEIEKLGNEIAELNTSISNTQEEIKVAEQDIEDSKNEIDEKKRETNELLKFLQLTSGENVYLEYLFEADSYTDFIYRYSIVEQMSDYNNTLKEELETLVSELEEKKASLAEKQEQLESQREESTSKRNTLRAQLSDYTEEGTTIEEDIRDLKAEQERYEAMGCGEYQDITTCNKTGSYQPVASGWTYPLVTGCVSSEYTTYRTDWNPGSEHHAIDLACVSEGTNVYAAAAGTVARVVYGSSCGGNMIWIYHNINGREYTTVYMHLLSINVSVDQVVYTDTVIGRVGGGSTAAANGGYDRCTTGTHLHFGTASGYNAYNFNSYSFNPRDVYTFPALYSGYFYR